MVGTHGENSKRTSKTLGLMIDTQDPGWYILFYTYWYRNAYKYIYIQYIYICVCVSKCVYITDIYRYMYIDISIHIQLYVYIYICVCVCIRSGEWEDGPCPAGQNRGVPNLLGCAHVGWGKDLALRLDGDLVTRADPLVSWPLWVRWTSLTKEENLPHFGL